jgi:uncharacterized protein (TIGR00255 family)
MLRSMTGFGRAEATSRLGKITVEIKTVNHRHFELVSRLPDHLSVLENKIKEYIHKEEIRRGKVSLYLQYERGKVAGEGLNFDRKAAANYYQLLAHLRKHLKLSDEIRLDQIIAFPGVITHEKRPEDIDRLWLLIKRALIPALNGVIAMRETEGKSLKSDLSKRIRLIEKEMDRIKQEASIVIDRYREKLTARIKELSRDLVNIDETRIAAEVTIFAERSDISEEITRIAAHLSAFKEKLSLGKEVGRALDFIIQEIHREINTISAKATSYNISKWAISVKNELEKIREQVQNIE